MQRKRIGSWAFTAVWVLACVVIWHGCATFHTNRITIGQSLVDLGDQFISTGNLYNQALTQKLITRDEYNKFAEFAVYFKAAYVSASKAYEAGTQSPQELRRVVKELNDELALYALTQIPK